MSADPVVRMAFLIRRAAAGWQLVRVGVLQPSGKVKTTRRGEDWRTTAGIDHVAAAIALLKLKAESRQEPLLDVEMGELERVLVERCGSAMRNAADGNTTWLRDVFGDWPRPAADELNPLRCIFAVPRRRPTTLRLVDGRPVAEFEFQVGRRRAHTEELAQFIGQVAGVPIDEVDLLDHERAIYVHMPERIQRQVDHENRSDHLTLALLGSHLPHAPEDETLIGDFIGRFAKWLPTAPWHLLVRPRGIGIDILEQTLRRPKSADLTFSLVFGTGYDLAGVANVALLIGGGGAAAEDASMLSLCGCRVIPLVGTGGAAAVPARHAWLKPRGLSDEDLGALQSARDPAAMFDLVVRLLEVAHSEELQRRKEQREEAAIVNHLARKQIRD